MNGIDIRALPAFDDATLRGHLMTIAETISATLNAGIGGDGEKRLRECAIVSARLAQALGERAPRDRVNAREEWEALTETETAFARERVAWMAAGIAPPAEGARQLDPIAVETYLKAHPLGGEDFRLVSARILSGGRCKLTAMIEHRGTDRLPAAMILRQDWDGGATDTTVADEFRLLELLHSEGLLTPRPYLLEPAENTLGLPFMLMQRMPGGLNASLFVPPSERTLAEQLAGQLGRLHGLPLDKVRQLGLPEATDDPDHLRATLDDYAATHADIGIGSATVDAALDWLHRHIHWFGAARCLTHNDVGFHNALTDGDRLTALLDWELASIGHPAADLGYIKHFIVRMMPWDDFLAVYCAAGGSPVDQDVLRFHTIWNAVRLYGLIMRARAAVAGGHVRDIEISYACADNLLLLLIFLGEELRAAGE